MRTIYPKLFPDCIAFPASRPLAWHTMQTGAVQRTERINPGNRR
jgi:hypothetical protein